MRPAMITPVQSSTDVSPAIRADSGGRAASSQSSIRRSVTLSNEAR